jgi:hypothetical protein
LGRHGRSQLSLMELERPPSGHPHCGARPSPYLYRRGWEHVTRKTAFGDNVSRKHGTYRTSGPMKNKYAGVVNNAMVVSSQGGGTQAGPLIRIRFSAAVYCNDGTTQIAKGTSMVKTGCIGIGAQVAVGNLPVPAASATPVRAYASGHVEQSPHTRQTDPAEKGKRVVRQRQGNKARSKARARSKRG